MPIYKRTNKRDGSTFYAATATGYDSGGKRIQLKRHVRTKAQARLVENQLRAEIERIKRDGKSAIFADFLPQYLDYITTKRKKTKGTVDSERSSLTNHALPILGNKQLDKITTNDIEYVIFEVLEKHSLQTRKHCFNYLNALFKLAIKRNHCSDNPCERAERIKVVRVRPKVILNSEQLKGLLQTTQKYFGEWLPHLMIACHCALRASEARGLQWADIDWDNNLILVNRTFNVKGGIKYHLKNKTIRTVPMSRELCALLRKMKEQREPAATEWILDRHVEFMRSEQAKVVRNICKATGVPECTFHELRSAAITNFLRSGIKIGTVMKIAGHKRLSSTNIYYDNAGENVKGTLNDIAFL